MDTVDFLATQLGVVLKARHLQLVLAESCTGGMLAQSITAIAGSSAWFDRGFITYSNAAKIEMLEVPAHTLHHFGAVSEPAAESMALGALKHSHAQLAISITGIAGPEGGSAEKPVGTVCFCVALQAQSLPVHMRTETVLFTGNRAEIRQQSVQHALEMSLALTLNLDL